MINEYVDRPCKDTEDDNEPCSTCQYLDVCKL